MSAADPILTMYARANAAQNAIGRMMAAISRADAAKAGREYEAARQAMAAIEAELRPTGPAIVPEPATPPPPPDPAPAPIGPARRMFAIVPSDNDEVHPLPLAIRVTGDGMVTLRAVDSDADVSLHMVEGEVLPVRALYVRAEGTTASLLGLA